MALQDVLAGVEDALRAALAPLAPIVEKTAADFNAAGRLMREAMDRTPVDFRVLAEVTRPVREGMASLAGGVVQMAAAVAPMVPTFQTLGFVVNTAIGAFQSITGAAAAFVQQSDPAEMIRFRMAIQDLMASVGVILAPIIEAGAQVADIFNRVFTELQPTLLPILQQFGQVMVQVGAVVAQAVRPVLAALAPILQLVVDLFARLVPVVQPALEAVAGALTNLLLALRPLIEQAIPFVVAAFRYMAEQVADLADFISGLTTPQGQQNISGAILQGFTILATGGAFGVGGGPLQEIIEAGRRNRPEMPLLGADQTFAARQAQMIGIEQLGEQARAAAFGARSQAQILEDQLAVQRRIEENTRPRPGQVVATPFGFGTDTGRPFDGPFTVGDALNGDWGI